MNNHFGRCVVPLVLILTAGSRHAFAHAQSLRPGIKEPLAAIDLLFVLWVALFILTALLACLIVEEYCDERQARLGIMRRFADTFIREFERPLIEQRAVNHPIRSRLRFIPRRQRFEILVAPNDGRTYPNLSDHRRNVEYDVERVSQLLGVESFVSGHLYAQGRWVVIPFQLKAGLKEEGAN